MNVLNMQIPPFVRIDLFQIILTEALSIGNLDSHLLCYLFNHDVTIQHAFYICGNFRGSDIQVLPYGNVSHMVVIQQILEVAGLSFGVI